MMNFFEAHNPPVNNPFINSSDMNEIKSSKSPQNQMFSDFLNNIREVQSKEDQIPKSLDFPQAHSVIFPVYDFSFVQADKKSIFSSQPISTNKFSPQLTSFQTVKPLGNESN
jgi:hypothetical protein